MLQSSPSQVNVDERIRFARPVPSPRRWSAGRNAPGTRPVEGFDADGVRALWIDGPIYRGKPTRFFAWMGMPPGAGPREKVPGMVLVHGGGGSAFAHWVRMWNQRGYAAIAMDTCGHTPDHAGKRRDQHPDGGPPGWGRVDAVSDPETDQWVHHAVETVMRSHDVLRAQPGVDPGRIGLTGISWGGVLTAIVAGHDPRYRMAVPVYGSGFLRESPGLGFAGFPAADVARWDRLWDPARHVGRARMPMLWINGTNDFAFTPPMWQSTHRLPGGRKWLTFPLEMPHGHVQGEVPVEIGAFADHILRGGPALARAVRTTGTGTRRDVRFDGGIGLESAHLLWTGERSGKWPDRKWQRVDGAFDRLRRTVSVEIPVEAAFWAVNVVDRLGNVSSSEIGGL
jgi:dienelactone hydrolase